MTRGHLLVQDRDGAPSLIERCRDTHASLGRFFADDCYAAPKVEAAIAHLDCLTIEIIKRSDTSRFVILFRRWVIKRSST